MEARQEYIVLLMAWNLVELMTNPPDQAIGLGALSFPPLTLRRTSTQRLELEEASMWKLLAQA
jgi:hypothetical protein